MSAVMDKTVSVRGMVVTAAVLLAVVVAYLLGQGGGTPALAARADQTTTDSATTAPSTLTLRGVGEVRAVPDQVSFQASVALVRPDLTTALDDANATLAKVLVALGKNGVAKSDTETTGLSMSPVYTHRRDEPPLLRGYRVSEQVAVLVTDLKGAGAAISAVVDAGGRAVRVSDIGLKVGDPDALLGRARSAAVADAKEKAGEYAAATGQTLGAVRTLVEVNPQSVTSQVSNLSRDYAALDSVAALSPVPVRAGHSQVSVTVQVVWALQ